jgi:hypothetical protein
MKRAALLLTSRVADDPWMTCDLYLRAIERSPQSAREAKTWASGFCAGVATAKPKIDAKRKG